MAKVLYTRRRKDCYDAVCQQVVLTYGAGGSATLLFTASYPQYIRLRQTIVNCISHSSEILPAHVACGLVVVKQQISPNKIDYGLALGISDVYDPCETIIWQDRFILGRSVFLPDINHASPLYYSKEMWEMEPLLLEIGDRVYLVSSTSSAFSPLLWVNHHWDIVKAY